MARWSDVFAMIFAVVACACLLAALAMHGCPDARPAHVPFRSRPSRTSGRPALDGKYDYTWQGGKGVVVIRPQGAPALSVVGGSHRQHWASTHAVCDSGDALISCRNERASREYPLPSRPRGEGCSGEVSPHGEGYHDGGSDAIGVHGSRKGVP